MVRTRARNLISSFLSGTGLAVVAFLVASAGAAWSQPVAPVDVREILRGATTTSGNPIILPQGPVETIVARYHIAAHATLPVHKHPFFRLGYVLAGSLQVSNLETGRSRVFGPGEAIVEDIDQWHSARNLTARPVELLVVDLVPPGVSNTVQQK